MATTVAAEAAVPVNGASGECLMLANSCSITLHMNVTACALYATRTPRALFSLRIKVHSYSTHFLVVKLDEMEVNIFS